MCLKVPFAARRVLKTSLYNNENPFDPWTPCGELRKRFLPRQVSSIPLSSLLALDKITLASLLQDCKTFIFQCNRSAVATCGVGSLSCSESPDSEAAKANWTSGSWDLHQHSSHNSFPLIFFFPQSIKDTLLIPHGRIFCVASELSPWERYRNSTWQGWAGRWETLARWILFYQPRGSRMWRG